MNYKIEKTLKKNKNLLIVVVILWVLLSIVLVSPIAVSIVESTKDGVLDIGECIVSIFSKSIDIGNNLSKIFKSEYIVTYLKTNAFVTIILLFCSVIGFFKSMPKHEYTDIEQGSSEWASGEQYSVLDKKKGIILAENHYLPVDKRGNVNVLVVGRFRIR